MKKAFFFLFTLCTSCLLGLHASAQGNNVNIEATTLPGFNINNFANLVRQTNNPSELEKAINSDNNDINNLDLNKDGMVDFLKVIEGANQIQVIDDVDATNAVTVATLNLSRRNDVGDVQIVGSPVYCGPYYTYHSSFPIAEVLFFSYLFSPHRYYVPMYHYGYYPPYYRRYGINSYRTVTHTYTRSTTIYRGGAGRPSSFRPSVNNRTSISSPASSQRSFSPRNTGSTVRSGSFGNRPATASSGSFSTTRPATSATSTAPTSRPFQSSGRSFSSGSSSPTSTSRPSSFGSSRPSTTNYSSGSRPSAFGSGRSYISGSRSGFGSSRSGFGRRH
ncbi:hypothetical protein [Parasediminibacterium sp. JCM 36343]|uniref:hypothetical protein n=1 Tax=Parasediminibacterium sp. JCM 36343 TaxID=3374279 RepID=UPI003978CE0B